MKIRERVERLVSMNKSDYIIFIRDNSNDFPDKFERVWLRDLQEGLIKLDELSYLDYTLIDEGANVENNQQIIYLIFDYFENKRD